MKKKLNIALISPRTGLYRHGTGVFPYSLRYAPLNVVTLAALIPQELRGEVTVYDESVETIDPTKIKADIVGLTGITGVSMRSYAYCEYFRRQGITTVMGGPHATLMPEEAAKHADAVVMGHAYETWPKLLDDFCEGRLQKFYHPPKEIEWSLIPDPRRDFFAQKKFITTNSTQAVFGCPNQCEFCVTPIICKGKYERRPIEDVVNEVRNMGGRYVTFLDPSPVENVDYAIALNKAMIPLKKRWGGLATTRIVDNPELLDSMEASGCFGLLIGFETLTKSSNANIGKGFNDINKYKRLMNELHSRNISVMGCFVHGLDNDDPDCFDRTLDFILDAKVDLPRFTICTPFPGTPFFNRLKKEGRILTENWTLYDAQHVVFQPKHMTIEQLEEGHHRAWKTAYSISNIFQRLAGSRTFLEYTILANIGYRFYSRGHKRFSRQRMANDWKLSCSTPEDIAKIEPAY
ncbi:MAG: radical SAM protein [Candidatus Rifleibacteriota bacterium]